MNYSSSRPCVGCMPVRSVVDRRVPGPWKGVAATEHDQRGDTLVGVSVAARSSTRDGRCRQRWRSMAPLVVVSARVA